jgi:hypothetical protein
MKTIQAQIPEPVLKQAQELADRENIPLAQIISLAVAQSIGIWSNESYVAARAKRASREKFLDALKEVPDVEPPDHARCSPDDRPSWMRWGRYGPRGFVSRAPQTFVFEFEDELFPGPAKRVIPCFGLNLSFGPAFSSFHLSHSDIATNNLRGFSTRFLEGKSNQRYLKFESPLTRPAGTSPSCSALRAGSLSPSELSMVHNFCAGQRDGDEYLWGNFPPNVSRRVS